MLPYYPVAKIMTAELVIAVLASYNQGKHQRYVVMSLFPGGDGLTMPERV